MTTRQGVQGLLVLGLAYLLVRVFWMASAVAGPAFNSATLESTAKIVIWGCGCLPVALWLARDRTAAALGLDARIDRGLAFGLVATLPMAAALLLIPHSRPFSPDLALGSALLGPFAEELLFRGFLFGLLWRIAGWPPSAAIAMSALLFGGAHQMEVFPMIAGGVVLGWVAYRWNSLWPAVAMHGCMNLWWDLSLGNSLARAPVNPDLMSTAQVISVALAVGMTLRCTASSASGTSGARTGLTLANDP
ncbi:MAG TPA: CPBP family intramembrane glutamic endopeptidase [Vicinamibacterales bacterium]|nr:CPBP family intramembrane glutamic endopeptidase [Vicinamibacterales bacterium]